MPLTLTEKLDSRKWNTGENASVEMVYILTGTADDVAAKALIESSTAETYNGLVRQSINLEPEWVDTAASDGQWLATVRYGVKPPAEVGESSFSFDTGGGTQHITQSISTIQRYAPPGKTAPDFKGAIGVTHDNVEGVDITVPVFNFTVRRRLPIAQWTAAYVGTLYALTGKVNNAGFSVTINGNTYSFAAGECLFLGASGDESSASEFVEVNYRFAASPNRTGITVGDIVNIAKKGWEYLWVRYADSEDAAAKAIIKKPVAAYVEKVYQDGAFGGLEPPP
jgi:hypothetical protein